MATGVVVWWMLFHIRMSHAGKVCSGDYLSYSHSTEGYLIDTGDFIIYFLYFTKISLIILACYAYWYVFTHYDFGRAFGHHANRSVQENFAIATTLFVLILVWIILLPSLGGPVMILAVLMYFALFKATGYVPIRMVGMERSDHGQGAPGWEQRIRNHHIHL